VKVNGRDRGATLPIVAIALPVLMVMTAFAVDLGRQRSSRRTMQARADIVALDLVRLADGRTEYDVLHDPGYATYLQGSAARNDVAVAKLTIDWGTFDAVAGFIPTLDNAVPNAVKVTATETTDYFFQRGSGSSTRSAVATTEEAATGQIGSGLVNVSSSASATLDGVLRRAFGINSAVALGLLNYNGLAGATVNLNALAAALGFGSPQELADGQVTARSLLLASGTLLRNQGDTAAADVFDWYGTAIAGSTMIDMGRLLQLEQGGPNGAAGSGIDAFGLLTGSAYVINGTNTISVPSVTTNIAGVTSTALGLNVVQAPIQWSGSVGDGVDTQQVGLNLTAQVDLPLNVAGLVGAHLVGSIPVNVSVAGARGTITDIDCDSSPGITLGATGRPVSVQTGLDLDVWSKINVLLTSVDTRIAEVNSTAALAPPGGGSNVRFDHPTQFLPDIGTGGMVHGPGTSLGLSQALAVSGAQITALGVVPLNLGAISTAINTALQPVLDQLAAYALTISAQLGVDIGGSDLAAVDMTCGRARLVG
jgi:uncharacterized membrane protein